MADFKQYLEDVGYGDYFAIRFNNLKRDSEYLERELDLAVDDAKEQGYEVDNEMIKKIKGE